MFCEDELCLEKQTTVIKPKFQDVTLARIVNRNIQIHKVILVAVSHVHEGFKKRTNIHTSCRRERGILANPLQAAGASAGAFFVGGAFPLAAALLVSTIYNIPAIAAVAVLALALLGAGGARLGGAPMRPALIRAVVWGVVAMVFTAGVGQFFDVAV